MRHYAIRKRWFHRHWRCACGRPLDRCTEYYAALSRPGRSW